MTVDWQVNDVTSLPSQFWQSTRLILAQLQHFETKETKAQSSNR